MSEVKVNKISPRTNCGTTTLGDSGDSFVIPSGVTITNNGTQTGFGRTGTVDWDTTAKTTAFTAVSGVGYFVNTTSGAITVTLPATPSSGDIVSVSDYNGTASTNAITIARNGSNINGDAADFSITKADSAITFVYVDGTVGWTSVQTSNTTDTTNPFIVASGGTVTCCGDYKIHTFTGPGTFTVTNAGNPLGSDTVDYLVVAGGGAGGNTLGGGGGAGGYRTNFPSPAVAGLPVTTQGYPITIGSGGARGTGCSGPGPYSSPGTGSSFSSITSAGGGAGGNYNDPSAPIKAGSPGGSGGGGSGSNGQAGGAAGLGNTPPVAPPQGNNGGTGSGPGFSIGNAGGGGGGGASAVGGNNPGPSVGGAGSANSITGSPVTYAGGGGGARYGTPTANNGGAGGGGSGGSCSGPTAATSGTVNTGGGGGGWRCSPAPGQSAGGSGIVIIRYKFQ